MDETWIVDLDFHIGREASSSSFESKFKHEYMNKKYAVKHISDLNLLHLGLLS